MFTIDLMSRTPVYEQIVKQTENLILMGVLKPGDKMPSVRSLSLGLSVNPNTIQKAYTQLDMRKIIHTVPGKGSYVSEHAEEIIGKHSRERLEGLSSVLRELALAGVEKSEILTVVDEIFNKEHTGRGE